MLFTLAVILVGVAAVVSANNLLFLILATMISTSQAGTNCVRVYVGDGKIRSAESARYFLTWIGELRKMTLDASLWRTEAERAHVHRQFDEAVKVYERKMAEAR